MVNELIDTQNRCWKEDIIRQTFYPHEAKQIYSIPITCSDQEDFLSWQGTKDGIYSVRSGYQALMEWQNNNQTHSSNTHNEDNPKWKKLWKLCVPPKQLHLIWRILNNAIPVKEKLFKRGIKCVPLCSYCNNYVETIDHIFLECEWVKKVWFASPLTINFEHVMLKKFQDWFEYMLQESRNEELQTISTILYSIWQARNDREFNGKNVPPTDMMQRAMQTLHEFQANQGTRAMSNPTETVKIRNDISWSLPPKEALKLNVDAHSLSDGRWGIGLLLRRDDGSCVGAVTLVRMGSDCALLAEAMGLQEAVTLVQNWNLHRVIIEMDAQAIVNAAHGKSHHRTIWGRIVDQCAKKMKERNDITLVWTRRDGNIAAHELAKWAKNEPNREWISSFPTCISHHIHKDMIFVPNC
jgi:ribonuclease HI